MSDAIVGTGSVIGFGTGHHGDNHEGHDDNGIRDMLHMGFRADGVRDVLEALRNGNQDLSHDVAAVGVAIERNGAANSLATEKTAAATALAIEKTAAASALEGHKNTATLAAQLAECCCEIKELVRAEACTTRELINSVEAGRIRDQLADAKQELLIAKLEKK